jgi:predicted transcriptional regulator of viral defense system
LWPNAEPARKSSEFGLTENVYMAERDVNIFRWIRPEAFDWLRGLPPLFRPYQLRDFGLTPDHLPALLHCGAIKRVCRGLYHRVDRPLGEYWLAVACARTPEGIVCLHSALRVHGIRSQAAAAAQDAARVWLAVPHWARAPRVDGLPLRLLRFSGRAWTFRVKGTEFDGVPARITTPARTVADCFRLAKLAGTRAGPEAFHDAIGRGLATLEELASIEVALPCRRLRAMLDLYPASGEIGERLGHRPAQ